MKKQLAKKLLLGVGILVALNVIYLLFMTFAFSIPADGKIKENIGLSLYTWQDEDITPIFDDAQSYFQDIGSDLIWANIAATRTNNPILAAIELPYKQVSFEGEGDVARKVQHLIQALYYPDSEETISTNYSRETLI